jgi:hypothetical protein
MFPPPPRAFLMAITRNPRYENSRGMLPSWAHLGTNSTALCPRTPAATLNETGTLQPGLVDELNIRLNDILAANADNPFDSDASSLNIQFHVTSVPEPSPALLCCSGGLSLAGMMVNRARKQRRPPLTGQPIRVPTRGAGRPLPSFGRGHGRLHGLNPAPGSPLVAELVWRVAAFLREIILTSSPWRDSTGRCDRS